MDYSEAIQYLEKAIKFGSKLGLERISKLMDIIGHPEKNIPAIHIAGTNGKGSVTSMIANILAASGYTVGIYTSPYVHRFSERIRVLHGEEDLRRLLKDPAAGEIEKDDFIDIVTEVSGAAEVMLKEGDGHPTEFEMITAVAFKYFDRKKCDYMVLETGLGGRLDSTNIIPPPLVCAITAIGYDHMERLGNTIGAIAGEKSGIIKKGSKVILSDPKDYTTPEEAEEIIRVVDKAVKDKGASSLKTAGLDNIISYESNLTGQTLALNISSFIPDNSSRSDRPSNPDYSSIPDHSPDISANDIPANVIPANDIPTSGEEKEEIWEIKTSLIGKFQLMNITTAVAAACEIGVHKEAVLKGIALTRWPGRFEILNLSDPVFIVDGGHNPQCAMALRKTLEKEFPDREITFIYGVMADKDYKSVLREITGSRIYKIGEFICTEPDNPRALSAENLAETVKEILDNLRENDYNASKDINEKIYVEKDVAKAVNRALELSGKKDGIILAFGSLYMVGDVKKQFFELQKNIALV